MAAGIHHVTLITRKVQANVDFYTGFLGLRLVKRTAGFEDAAQLHLLYGDAAATPGSLITFLVWEDGSPGRAGFGQIGEIALAIDPGSIGFWLTRALTFGVRPEGPAAEFGEPTLRLKDPDGIIVKLTGVAGMAAAAPWAQPAIPAADAVRRIRGVTLLTEIPEQTRAFVETHFGYRFQAASGAITRLISASGDAVDIRDAQGFWSSAPGTGTVDHVAFRTADMAGLEEVHRGLQATEATATNMHDRKYFHSLYVREPGGILIELATDGPGMTVDETAQTLGTALFLPDGDAQKTEDLRVVLPQFAMPQEERVIYRDLPFVHRFHTPEEADGSTIVLLHGSGGNETSLLPLAHQAAPRATLLGLRGRSVEEGAPRWFRRQSSLSFDQQDIRNEAAALVAFMEEAIAAYRLDPDRLLFLGHSNGANFLGACLFLHPDLIQQAALLRPIPVLDDVPVADLAGRRLLLTGGETDAYAAASGTLADDLRRARADVRFQIVAEGHDTGASDVAALRAWL